MKPVPEPPDLDISNFHHAIDMIGNVANLIGNCRVNAIKKSGEDSLYRIPDDPEYHNRDDEPDHRVGEREPEIDPDCTDKDRKAREPVRAW